MGKPDRTFRGFREKYSVKIPRFVVISGWMMSITAGNAAGLRKQPVFVTTQWTVVLEAGIIGILIPIQTAQ